MNERQWFKQNATNRRRFRYERNGEATPYAEETLERFVLVGKAAMVLWESTFSLTPVWISGWMGTATGLASTC